MSTSKISVNSKIKKIGGLNISRYSAFTLVRQRNVKEKKVENQTPNSQQQNTNPEHKQESKSQRR